MPETTIARSDSSFTTSAAAELPERLAELQLGIRSLLVELQPDAVAVERVFFQNNVRTAIEVLDGTCWYGEPSRHPSISRCPSECNGATTHGERQADTTR